MSKAANRLIVPIILIFALSFTAGSALAQEEELSPCPGDQVSGTVVAVDEETGTVTVDTGEGLCTVGISSGDYDHPIVALLGAYFQNVSAEDLQAALDGLQAQVACDELGCSFGEGGDPGTVVGVVDNGDGTFTVELALEGQEEHIFITTDDSQMASDFQSALDALAAEWNLNVGEDGSATIADAGDEIAAYHEDGLGFGVLVKFYAIATESQACTAETTGGETGEEDEGPSCTAVSVDELVTAFKSGTGMGLLFKEYGKPAMLGVGHVRQAMDADKGPKGVKGICNARAKGGNAHGKGHGDVVCTSPEEPVEP